MLQVEYELYCIFKKVENEIKDKKNSKIWGPELYEKRVSESKRDVIRQCSLLFSTRYANINVEEYIRCGFHHFKTFDFDKMFRDIVLKEYIARDKRSKRKLIESKEKILSDLEYIGQPLSIYTQRIDGTQKNIILDYMENKIGPTIIMYCIRKGLFRPSDIDWEYLSVLSNNKDTLNKCVLKHYDMITQWDRNEEARQTTT